MLNVSLASVSTHYNSLVVIRWNMLHGLKLIFIISGAIIFINASEDAVK